MRRIELTEAQYDGLTAHQRFVVDQLLEDHEKPNTIAQHHPAPRIVRSARDNERDLHAIKNNLGGINMKWSKDQ